MTTKIREYLPCTQCNRSTTSRWKGKPLCVHHRECACGRPARQYKPGTKKPVCAACNMAWRRQGP